MGACCVVRGVGCLGLMAHNKPEGKTAIGSKGGGSLGMMAPPVE